MKKYLLLRDNRESGPYSLEQLAQMRLHPRDLLWIEKESNKWKFPGELAECISLIKHDCTEIEMPRSRPHQQIDPQAPASPAYPAITAKEAGCDKAEHDTKYTTPLVTRKNKWHRGSITVLAVSLGVMLAAPVVKNLVEDNTTPRSGVLPVIDRKEHTKPGPDFKKTIVTEIVPVYTQPAPGKTQDPDYRTHKRLENTKCRLAAFDGINGTQLTVFNTSSEWVDKALVSLDYI